MTELTDTELRSMHKQNQTAIKSLEQRMDIYDVLFFGKRDDPKDNGLKGDIQAIKTGLRWLIRSALALMVVFIFTRYPELAKLILELVHA